MLRVPVVVVALTLMWLVVFGSAGVAAMASGTTIGRAVGAVLLAVGLVVVIRSARSALLVNDAGVTVRNAWRTRSWCWSAIDEVGWDIPAWNREPLGAISVCVLGDPYAHTASATATGARGQSGWVIEAPFRSGVKGVGLAATPRRIA